MLTLDWLVKMCDLPEVFLHSHPGSGGGVIQCTASDATLAALLAAKHKALERFGPESVNKLVAYTSVHAHLSVTKGARIANVKLHSLDCDDHNSLRGETLQRAIEDDKEKGLIPFFVAATFGTTNLCAFDNCEELGVVARDNDLWIHIDAAYAGSALVCPEFRYLMKGIELVDSFNFNVHKWLRVNFDCSAMYVRNSIDLIKIFNSDAVYMKHDYQQEIPDFKDWQIPLGRRSRSLKIWMVLKSYGVSGLQDHIRNQVRQAKLFEEMVRADDRFEIVNDVLLGLVCFRLKGSNSLNEELNRKCNEEKKIFLTPASACDKFVLRFVITSVLTEDADVKFAWDEIRKHADVLTK